MPGSEWINHKGKKIFYIDLVSESHEEMKKTCYQAALEIANQPPKSVLCLTNTKDARFFRETPQLLKEFTKSNEPYMLMTAVVGVEGFQRALYTGILMFTRRKNLVLKGTKEEALDWLAGI